MRTDAGEIVFSQHRRVLSLYAEAMAGETVVLRSSDEAPSALQIVGHDLPSSEGESLYLPARVVALPAARSDFATYKIVILHQLAYRDLGSLDFEWRRWLDFAGRLAATGRPTTESSAESASEATTAYQRFFNSFRRPSLAKFVFGVLEDTRVDAYLRRSFPGLRQDLALLMRHCLHSRPPIGLLATRDALLEALVQLSLEGTVGEAHSPHMAELLGRLHTIVDRLRAPQAGIYDTAAATVEAYAICDRQEAFAARSPAVQAASTDLEDDAPPATIDATIEPQASDGTYDAPPPVPFRGAFDPETVQRQVLIDELAEELERLQEEIGNATASRPLDTVDGQSIDITGAERGDNEGGGMPVTDLDIERVSDRLHDVQQQLADLDAQQQSARGPLRAVASDTYTYDEWDHDIGSYRADWCRLHEALLAQEDSAGLHRVLRDSATLLADIRRQFERLKPELLRKIHRLVDGEEIDLDSAIEARVDRLTGHSILEKVYTRRARRERDVAAAFLLDMSASTDSEVADSAVEPPAAQPTSEHDFTGILGDEDDWLLMDPQQRPRRRKVIDVEKEAVLLMAESLETLGDAYAIYGFSGFGREQVDFFVAKEFADAYSETIRRRLAAIKPQRSTRMGPAIRHSITKLEGQQQRIKALLILSDGYPQDHDYGADRSSRTYGIQDTMMALREAQLRGIHTFCITVDPAGHDYLREMCPGHQYLVIDDLAALPRELPKVYRGLTM